MGAQVSLPYLMLPLGMQLDIICCNSPKWLRYKCLYRMRINDPAVLEEGIPKKVSLYIPWLPCVEPASLAIQ